MRASGAGAKVIVSEYGFERDLGDSRTLIKFYAEPKGHNFVSFADILRSYFTLYTYFK